jgi:hypothetical protein
MPYLVTALVSFYGQPTAAPVTVKFERDDERVQTLRATAG